MPYNFCCLVVVFFTLVNFDPWFVFSKCCCLHLVFCCVVGKETINGETCILMSVLNLEANKHICFLL